MEHPIICTLCDIGRYIVPPYHRCKTHGLFCTGCSLVNKNCPLCRQPLNIDNCQFDLSVRLACVNKPECQQLSWPLNYDNHYSSCVNGNSTPTDDRSPHSLQDNGRNHDGSQANMNNLQDDWNNQLEYNGENPIMAHVHALQAQRQAQILNNKAARRRRRQARRRNGTTIRQPSPDFSGNIRPG